MSKGRVRYGEEDKIPLDRPVWGIILRYPGKGYQIDEESIYFSTSDNKYLIDQLASMTNKDALYIIWHGSWNTDVFRCDPKKIIKRIQDQEVK